MTTRTVPAVTCPCALGDDIRARVILMCILDTRERVTLLSPRLSTLLGDLNIEVAIETF